MEPEPVFFASPKELRDWFELHHETQDELWLGNYRKATGKQTITWSESVDQALCFGWIDGVRKTLNQEAYMQRFTPRRPGSNWSAVNVEKVAKLTEQGLMRPAGIAAFERRLESKTGVYSYEQKRDAQFEDEHLARFQANEAAWDFFLSQAPWYRRTAIHWVLSAKRQETRDRRLATLIEDSEAGRRLRHLSQPTRKKP